MLASNAPTSQLSPCGRVTPRWSRLFTGAAAELVKYQLWHKDQEVGEIIEGTILRIPVHDDREIMMKIMQYGSLAQVLHPRSLCERIREEIAAGNTPQGSIHSGYEKALSSIADANITTLIAAIVLFAFGTGPIKGFAITLSLGIITSMFTAIIGTRSVVNAIFGGRRLESLPV